MRILLTVAAVAIYLGWSLPLDQYITPKRGLGYGLGVVGGSLIVVLLLYPARKRLPALHRIGSVKSLFRLHMALGVVAPVLILFHSNFALGAINSNVALLAMLVVASSGLVGRYLYARTHLGLYGRRATHADLQAATAALAQDATCSMVVPQLLSRLETVDRELLRRAPGQLRGFLRPWRIAMRAAVEFRRLRRFLLESLAEAAAYSGLAADEQEALRSQLLGYVRRRLQTTRRIAELESFERLFSVWHLLHLPLFFMLLIAGIVHVIAVHVY